MAKEWSLELEVAHPNAAGIDVGNEAHYVAVPPDRDSEPVKRFECFTADLYRMADWLEACGIETVAMQATGVYWLALYEILTLSHPRARHLGTSSIYPSNRFEN